MKMTTDVEVYFKDGCGRCELGGTPACKVHTWDKELVLLRKLILDSGLTEESKWGMPCYTLKGANVLLLSAFKEYVSVSFFKGALLKDSQKLLEKQGENTQAARLFKFTDVEKIIALEADIKAYIFEAIEVEKAGLKVELKSIEDYDIPEELQTKFDELPELEKAFYSLTMGRQKGYIIHFSGSKQSKTRVARIEKFIPHIMVGKGFFDK
jgi:uncharacterized protein YdeI (YjbR/CyaY-like superfamily)